MFSTRDDRYKLIHPLLYDQVSAPTSVDDLSRRERYDGTITNTKEIFNPLDHPPVFELYDLVNDPYELDDLFP